MSAIQNWTEMIRAEHAQSDRMRKHEPPPADSWTNLAQQFRADPRRTDDPLVDHLRRQDTEEQVVLDVGAGGGRMALPLALSAKKVIAVEPSPSMCRVLREAAAEFEHVLSGGDSRFQTFALNHLGAIALQGKDYDKAADYYGRALDSDPPDQITAEAAFGRGSLVEVLEHLAASARPNPVLHGRVLLRLGRAEEARAVLEPITASMQIIENFAYHELLLLYKGQRTPEQILHSDAEPGPVGQPIDDATRGYGVGAWHLVNGRDQQAGAIFRQVVEGTGRAAFGHIAAEAELARGENGVTGP